MSLERALRAAFAPREEWDFSPPPEAPVFEPSREEFRDPLAYIAKIRPLAEHCGICKIRPPDRWQPPFALDVDSLRFVPRVQRLNELEALTRLRLHFEDRLRKFWDLRGFPCKNPIHDGKRLDLFGLYNAVRIDGGYEECNASKKWQKIASFLGLGGGYPAAYAARTAYEKVLLPFDAFWRAPDSPKREVKDEGEGPSAPKKEEDDKPTPPRTAERASRRLRKTKTGSDFEADPARLKKCSRELRRLASYGAGPKMAVCEELAVDDKKEAKRPKLEVDPLAVHACAVCRKETSEQDMIVCGGCCETYHARCLSPPLERPPQTRWQCRSCIAGEMRKPIDAFGFAQAEKEYTLQQFGEMADRFKTDYFGMPGHLVAPASAEREFWRIVSSTEEDVTVEYGADLHSMDHGSGFPTKSSINLFPGDQEYVDSGWNLNNLPVLDGSVLRFINDDISGMTVPWMYVGMCFSAFCWHNEDHWSYSINYLHWGERKTWYGVPGDSAELLESTMRDVTPELFRSQPDLLHQLVTILNPNVLQEAGVPIYRTDQSAGEFVVTFPRSYHAGFNQGYNFAEAVNFAPPDWLSVGRECVLHYKNLKRFCVFSHEELVCKMGLVADALELATAVPAYRELVTTVRAETRQRGRLSERGVRRAARRHFELLPDDERLCEVCKTTCFLSALACETCSVMVCLDHAEEACECPPETLLLNYRYDLDELHLMIRTMKYRINSFDRWTSSARALLESSTLEARAAEVERLLAESIPLKIPKCRLLERLMNARSETEQPRDPIVIELDD